MKEKDLKKYVTKEMQKDINDRKTLHDKYRKYNNIMNFFSLFISIILIFSFLLLFDYQVLRPHDIETNSHFSMQSSIISTELATVQVCNADEIEEDKFFIDMINRLEKENVLMFLTDSTDQVIYYSDAIDKFIINSELKYTLEIFREKYIVEKHEISKIGYTMYFLIPKSDLSILRSNFLAFIAAIFAISALFRWGFSRSVMKRVYKNMIEPLEKIKKGTNEIRNGNFDYELEIPSFYNRELKETFKDFEKMREELKNKKIIEQQYENNRKELISNISHDLKTPISSIIGYMEGILDGVANTPAKKDRYMQIIYKKSLDMNRLINDLILFSKLDVNKVIFNYEKCNFSDYMIDLADEYSMELRENGIELLFRSEIDEKEEIYIDKKQLRRVFNNTIGNAMKHFSSENKAVEIMVYEDNNKVTVRISDNGEGIEADKVKNIFDRFYKADNSRNTEQGSSGLGLSISKQIVIAHGGDIWAESVKNKGTTIYFTLSKNIKEIK